MKNNLNISGKSDSARGSNFRSTSRPAFRAGTEEKTKSRNEVKSSGRAGRIYSARTGPDRRMAAGYSKRTFRVGTADSSVQKNDHHSVKDAISDLFTLDIPMTGDKFDYRKFFASHKKYLVIAGGLIAGVVVLISSFILIFRNQSGTLADNPSPILDEVGIIPLEPLDTVAKSEGQDTGPDYYIDKEKKVLGYNSEYNGVNLTISQQNLPENIRKNSDNLILIAEKFGEYETLETQKGNAYITTAGNSGGHIAVFATDESLVFIQSEKELLPDDWEFYINQLSPKI